MAQEERCRLYNFAVTIASKLRDLMFYLNGGGQHQQESSDKVVYDDVIGMPPFKTPNEVVDFVNTEFSKELNLNKDKAAEEAK